MRAKVGVNLGRMLPHLVCQNKNIRRDLIDRLALSRREHLHLRILRLRRILLHCQQIHKSTFLFMRIIVIDAFLRILAAFNQLCEVIMLIMLKVCSWLLLDAEAGVAHDVADHALLLSEQVLCRVFVVETIDSQMCVGAFPL